MSTGLGACAHSTPDKHYVKTQAHIAMHAASWKVHGVTAAADNMLSVRTLGLKLRARGAGAVLAGSKSDGASGSSVTAADASSSNAATAWEHKDGTPFTRWS